MVCMVWGAAKDKKGKNTYLGLPGCGRDQGRCGRCGRECLATLLAVVVVALSELVVSVVGFVVFGVPAGAVAVVVVTLFINALREEGASCCWCWCCDWCCCLLHKCGTSAAEVEGIAGLAIGADKPETAIAWVKHL